MTPMTPMTAFSAHLHLTPDAPPFSFSVGPRRKKREEGGSQRCSEMGVTGVTSVTRPRGKQHDGVTPTSSPSSLSVPLAVTEVLGLGADGPSLYRPDFGRRCHG